jgi:hypothetical protein
VKAGSVLDFYDKEKQYQAYLNTERSNTHEIFFCPKIVLVDFEKSKPYKSIGGNRV